jgi:HK97 family phage major capsid protein
MPDPTKTPDVTPDEPIAVSGVQTMPDGDGEVKEITLNPESVAILVGKVKDALDKGVIELTTVQLENVEKSVQEMVASFIKQQPSLNVPSIAELAQAGMGDKDKEPASETPLLDRMALLAAAKTGNMEVVNRITEQYRKKDQLIGTDAVGGYIVEREDGGLIDLTTADGMLAGLCQSVPMKTNAIRLPTASAAPTVYTVAESTDAGTSTATTESTATFGAVTLTVYRHGAFVQISNELMEDSDPAIEGLLRQLINKAVLNAMDWSILHGTGAAGAAGTASLIEGLINKITTNVGSAGGSVSFPNIVDLMAPEDYADGDINLVMHPAVRRELIKTVDGNGRPIWESGFQTGGLDAALGMGIVKSRQVSRTLGAGNDSVIFSGAFRDSGWVGLKSGVSIIIDPYTVAEYNSTRFIVNYRAGFQVSDESHFAMLNGITMPS